MKSIKGDLILKKDTIFKESITVEGNIKGRFDLKVEGNIDCLDIDCGNIDCWDINCRNIDCLDIIYCEKLTKKTNGAKIRCKVFIDKRSTLEIKEVEK